MAIWGIDCGITFTSTNSNICGLVSIPYLAGLGGGILFGKNKYFKFANANNSGQYTLANLVGNSDASPVNTNAVLVALRDIDYLEMEILFDSVQNAFDVLPAFVLYDRDGSLLPTFPYDSTTVKGPLGVNSVVSAKVFTSLKRGQAIIPYIQSTGNAGVIECSSVIMKMFE